MNNIWQIKFTKPGAIETMYFCVEREGSGLNKKKLNELLQLFRDRGCLVSLRGYGHSHYEKFKDTTRMFGSVGEMLHAMATAKFHAETRKAVKHREIVRVDKFYITSKEWLDLVYGTKWDIVEYGPFEYTFIGRGFPKRLADGLGLLIAKSGSYYYRGNMSFNVDPASKTVEFENNISRVEYVTRVEEI